MDLFPWRLLPTNDRERTDACIVRNRTPTRVLSVVIYAFADTDNDFLFRKNEYPVPALCEPEADSLCAVCTNAC